MWLVFAVAMSPFNAVSKIITGLKNVIQGETDAWLIAIILLFFYYFIIPSVEVPTLISLVMAKPNPLRFWIYINFLFMGMFIVGGVIAFAPGGITGMEQAIAIIFIAFLSSVNFYCIVVVNSYFRSLISKPGEVYVLAEPQSV